MLVELEPWLFIGGDEDCGLALANQRVFQSWAAILHVAKWPCHARAVGYGYDSKVVLAKTHPEYLWAERPGSLYLNVVDAPIPIFRLEIFTRALDYIDAMLGEDAQGRRILLHCNEGLSRAPSLALLYLAKRAELLPNDSFAVAREAFLTKYPLYAPGAGLGAFLTERWGEIQ